MNYSQKKYEYNQQYSKNNYKRVPLEIAFSDYAKVKEAAIIMNQSVNGFIKDCIFAKIADMEKAGIILGKADPGENKPE